jgi:hypothetical protein
MAVIFATFCAGKFARTLQCDPAADGAFYPARERSETPRSGHHSTAGSASAWLHEGALINASPERKAQRHERRFMGWPEWEQPTTGLRRE